MIMELISIALGVILLGAIDYGSGWIELPRGKGRYEEACASGLARNRLCRSSDGAAFLSGRGIRRKTGVGGGSVRDASVRRCAGGGSCAL